MENNNKQIQGKRIEWIDMAKGYAMLFVLLHHITFTPSIYRTIYAPFFLTAFFVTAGYVFSSERIFVQFLKRKIQTLIIPLFSLGIINILLSQIMSFDDQASFLDQIIELLLQNGTAGHRLWFIAAMFGACCIFFPISKLDGKWILIVCIILAGLI